MKEMSNRRVVIAVGVISVAIIGALFGTQLFPAPTPLAYVAAAHICVSEPNALSLEATAAYVWDIERERTLYAKHEFEQLPLASLTKLMTVLVASEILKENARIEITAEALTPEGDSGLYAGEVWEAQDLIDYTLITSSNDGSHALALGAMRGQPQNSGGFIDAMNAHARSLGLTQTYFLNDTGLDVSTTTSGAYGSARDIAALLTYVYRNKASVFDASSQKERVFTSLSGFTHDATHTSSVTGALSGEVVAKTGFTDLAGGNLGIVAEPILGRPIAIVVLGSSKSGRDHDVTELYEYAKSTIKRSILCEESL